MMMSGGYEVDVGEEGSNYQNNILNHLFKPSIAFLDYRH